MIGSPIRHYEGCDNRTILSEIGRPSRCFGCGSDSITEPDEVIFCLDRILLSYLRARRGSDGEWLYRDIDGGGLIFGHRFRVVDIGDIKS